MSIQTFQSFDILCILTLIGGLALFLFGMNSMGQGLEKLSGSSLERILEKLTSNPVKGVLLGALVTAIIQSSSATTVMVVGFVNSGIMKLSQAVGVIMGANIGTTMTAWILSLTGVEGEGIMAFFKPAFFTPILAIIGMILVMMCKSAKKKDIGTILVGFAILMTGMNLMSAAVKPLETNPDFQNVLTWFTNPLLGILAGAVLTAIIQSSSASVGILQAVASTGAINFNMAVPILMGQNIGTCVTAMLSSVGANKNAKRAAVIHLYFNLIGTVIFMIVYYTVTSLVDIPMLEGAVTETGVAIVHTVFNVFATALLLPFNKVLVKLATMTIRDKNDEKTATEGDEFSALETRLLATPSVALEQCKSVAVKMAECSRDTLKLSISLLSRYNDRDAEIIIENEDIIDNYEDKLGSYLLQLGSKNLTVNDSQTVNKLLHCIGDFERISDHAVNIMECAKEMSDKGLQFSKKATEEVNIFSNAIIEIIDTAMNAFEKDDMDIAKSVEPLEEVIDHIRTEVRSRHIKRLRKGKCTIEMGFVLTDLITNYERVADHCSNIAVCMIQVHDNNNFDMHGYLNDLKSASNEEFTNKFRAYSEKYMLP